MDALGIGFSAFRIVGDVMRIFGETGANMLARVLGVILAALAIQFVLDGIQESFL